ncbi:MAG: hypothetical protein Q9195_005530 [Heterodermia aff. obscurata]
MSSDETTPLLFPSPSQHESNNSPPEDPENLLDHELELPPWIHHHNLPPKTFIQHLVRYLFEERWQRRCNVLAYKLNTGVDTQDLEIVDDWEVLWEDRTNGGDEATASKQGSKAGDKDPGIAAEKIIQYRIIVFVKGQVASYEEIV